MVLERRKRREIGTLKLVTIPYVKGVSKALSSVFQRHGVATAMKPHVTLTRMLVHPKDKRTPQENAGVVYQFPCKDSPGVYTGEIERRYRVREKEHHRNVRSLEEVKFTRARKKESVSDLHPSAITDYVAKNNNHTIIALCYWFLDS